MDSKRPQPAEESSAEITMEEPSSNPFQLLVQNSDSASASRRVSDRSPQDETPVECFMDSDSGIDAMESEDQETKGPLDFRVEEVRQVILEVLNGASNAKSVTLVQQSCPKFAEILRTISTEVALDQTAMQNILSQLLMEIVTKIVHSNSCQDFLFAPIRTSQDSLSCSPSNEYYMAAVANSSTVRSSQLQHEIDLAKDSPEIKVFSYFLDCYTRLISMQSNESGHSDGVLRNLFTELRSQILRHCTLILSGTLWFSDRETYKFILLRNLALNILPFRFLEELMSHLEAWKPEIFDKIFRPVVDSTIRVLNFCSVSTDEFRQPLATLREMCQIKVASGRRPFCDMLVRQRDWLPAAISGAGGRELCKLSLFGMMTTLSALAEDDPKMAEKFSEDGLTDEAAKLCYQSVRLNLGTLREEIHQILFNIVANASSRDKALDFVSETIKRNLKKAQIMPDESELATDGSLLNLLCAMYLLSVKVTVDKINGEYPFHKSSRLEIGQESRLKMQSDEAQQFANSLDCKFEVKFPTECFFLTLHLQRVSLISAIQKHGRNYRYYREIERTVTNLERTESQWADTPQAARNRNMLKAHKVQLKKLSQSRYCMEAVLLDEVLLSRAFQFCTKTLSLLCSIICPDRRNQLPSLDDIPKQFGALPEFYLEDIMDFLTFAFRNAPDVLNEDACINEFVPSFLFFLCTPHCFNKPFLAAKLVEVMHSTGQQATYRLHKSLLNHPLACEALFRSLVKFYSDCEFTGSHTEFFDKFTIRYNIQVIFKSMWNDRDSLHRSIMIQQCRECGQEFIKFVNMLINDTTFLLDEVLEGLKRIYETQELRTNETAWSNLPQEDRSQRESRLAQDEGAVRSYMQLARETIDLFCYLTHEVVEPFLCPQLGARLAAMLNSNLLQLCGPKCLKLRVKNPEKYFFHPKELLNQLSDIYLNLDSVKFREFVAMDERSYSKDLLDSVINRLRRNNIKPISQIEQFELLAEQVFNVWKDNLQHEEDIGEIPEEFTDPIMGTVMRDPVLLPSGHIVDRNVILTHLFNDPKNPFNREPLSTEMLVDASDLKRRIEEWIADKMRQSLRKKAT